MINRTIFACLLITTLLSTLPSTAISGEVLRFKVFLDEDPIGHHNFRISDSGDLRRIASDAAFDVNFLFINAYRYRHNSNEVFRDGCLDKIRATTDDNGKQYRVEGSTLGSGFRLEHQDGVEQVEGCLMTFAYWDRGFLDQKRLLNSQNGELASVNVRRKGEEKIAVGDRQVSATRYALTTDEMTIDLWYNDTLGWVGLSSDTGKGRRIVYRRI